MLVGQWKSYKLQEGINVLSHTDRQGHLQNDSSSSVKDKLRRSGLTQETEVKVEPLSTAGTNRLERTCTFVRLGVT